MPATTAVKALLLGLGWGLLAALLGGRAIGSPVWGGVLASPLIGVVIARLSLGHFEATGGARRAAITLAGLAGGAILFGLATGITDSIQHPGTTALDTIGSHVVGVLWGTFVTGFVLFLWPLAWVSYKLLD
jgi:hypothetical protein